jgi:hypothetical protein
MPTQNEEESSVPLYHKLLSFSDGRGERPSTDFIGISSIRRKPKEMMKRSYGFSEL